MPVAVGTRRYTRLDSGLLVADGFNRADGALGRAETGQAWEVRTGTAAVAARRASFSAAVSHSLAVLPCGLADFDLAVTIATTAAGCGPAFCVGATGGDYLFVTNSASTWTLIKCVSGANTTLGSGAGARANGDVLRVRKVGADITVWRNGGNLLVHALSAANYALFGGGKWHGIHADNTTTPRFDDFSVRAP